MKFYGGLLLGFILGAGSATAYGLHAQSPSQPWNPYAPGSFNSSTNLYNSMISQDADQYLNSRRAAEPWSPERPCR